MKGKPVPGTLESITAGADSELAKASDKPDWPTRFEEQSWELARAETKLARTRIKSLKQDIGERKTYANRIFRMICGWVIILFVLLLCQGLGTWHWLGFSLSQPVLLAVVGSTTVNVLGLFYIVAHYLFPSPGELHKLHSGSQELRGNAVKKPSKLRRSAPISDPD